MSFAGLQKLASRKKEQGAGSDTSASPQTAKTSTDDIYAASTQRALAIRETTQPSHGISEDEMSRKRSRSPDEVSGPTPTPSTIPHTTDAAVAAMTCALKNKEDITQERQFADTTLVSALNAIQFSSCSSTSTADGSGCVLLGVPAALQRFCRSGEEVSSDRNAVELQLLEELHEELKSSNSVKQLPASSRDEENTELAKLGELIATIAWLLCAHWRNAVLGGIEEASQTREGNEDPLPGWSYEVYLLRQHAMPDVMKLQVGRFAAEELSKWGSSQKLRQSAAQLLGLLLMDYESLQAAKEKANASPVCIVPVELRLGLFRMLGVHLRQTANFAAGRQEYVDLTLGNANWRLGLFSGGEVHMRRSVERVERNRIAHLLNNERAMNLLHAVRELYAFAEGMHHDGGHLWRQFFCPTLGSTS